MEDTYGNTYQVALKNIPEILRSSLTLNRTATSEWSVLKLIRIIYCKEFRSLKIYQIQSDSSCTHFVWYFNMTKKKKTFHYDISLQISPI